MIFDNLYLFISRLFWKPRYDHPSLNKLCHFKNKPFEKLNAAFDDDEINSSFNNDNKNWYHNEFIYLLENNCLIEPSNKICIKGFRTLILESFSNSKERPSLIKYLLFRLSSKKSLFIDKAILFDGTLGGNYFHFFSDVITKIWLLEKYNFEKNIPLIIPKSTFDTPYFQYIYKKSFLKDMTWIVQDSNCWIKVKSLMLLKTYSYEKSYWKKTLGLLNHTPQDGNKKIFLTRSVAAGRYIRNMNSIENILKKYNFEIIDTGSMSFENQINTLAQAEVVISIHGAGNTNIIFSNWEKVKFIEILPSNRMACHYYWLSNSLGIYYDVIKGSKLDTQNAFELNPDLLEKAILKINN